MRHLCKLTVFLAAFVAVVPGHTEEPLSLDSGRCLRVVATLPDYGVLAKEIGGDRVTVNTIVRADQDAHFIRPRPSFVDLVRKADVLIATGLDLELWLPTVVDKSGNPRVRSGQLGYVAAAQGMNLLEKPRNLSRSEGGVHVYGNPHVTCSPINMRIAARNVATGLTKNDPSGAGHYQARLDTLVQQIDVHLFGDDLVQLLGGEVLCGMAEKGTLIPFLSEQTLEGKPLIDSLGGWMKQMLPLRDTPIVTYHKNWIYFTKLFGLEEAGTVEPKPGIPPSAKHVTALVELMRRRQIKVILAANYFDENKIRTVAERVNATPVIVSLYVEGDTGLSDYFTLVNQWTDGVLKAAGKQPLSRL